MSTASTDMISLMCRATTPPGSTTKGGMKVVSPARVVDTRTGLGIAQARLAPGSTTTMQLVARPVFPPGHPPYLPISPLLIRQIQVGPDTSFRTLQELRPTNALNYLHNEGATAMGTTIKLSSSGAISIYSADKGSINIIVDVQAYSRRDPRMDPSSRNIPVGDTRVAPRVSV